MPRGIGVWGIRRKVIAPGGVNFFLYLVNPKGFLLVHFSFYVCCMLVYHLVVVTDFVISMVALRRVVHCAPLY